jgi:hypothetical protein
LNLSWATGAHPGPGADGQPFIFAVITLKVVGSAGDSSELDVVIDKLQDATLETNDISATDQDGTFSIGAVPAVKVVINEFMSNNATEWVELFNNGSIDVDLTGWTLEDEGGTSKSLSDLGTITVGGYKVFTYSGTWLNNLGDVIWLNSTTGNIDRLGYGTSGGAPAPDAGNSTGRYPNGVDTDNDANDFIELGTPTPGAENIIGVIPGDITGDDKVDWEDFLLFADAYDTVSGDPNYNVLADIHPDTPDGDVDWEDFLLFADWYGYDT